MKITAQMLKRLIRDKSDRITDQELFTSEAMRNKFERMANSISKRYHRSLKVYLHWDCENRTYTVKTNNLHIQINAGNWIVQKYAQRTDRYRALLGLLAHDLEHELYKELDDNLARMTYAGAHLEITRHIFRQVEITEKMLRQYNAEAPELLKIADAACKTLRRVSLEQQRGGTRSGLYMGRGIRGSDLYRKDKRFFYNRKLPGKGFDIAIMVLCDESGSMDGERIDKTRQSAFLLYSICQKLNIPVSVYGHSADNAYDLELYSYAEFDSIDNKDCYRIMDMQSRNNNRDGVAIRFAAENCSPDRRS